MFCDAGIKPASQNNRVTKQRMKLTFLPRDTPILRFPDPRRAAGDVVAAGGNLLPETVQAAYAQGIFPWPHSGMPLLWFCPRERAILDFANLHIPESLAKARRKTTLTFTINRAFPEVIAACSALPRPEQEGTWITPEMTEAYIALNERGVAHSVEAWDTAGNLAGGLYGVDSGGTFSGESMFFRAPNASKLALLFLIDHLTERGLDFIDIQQLTPHMEALGAEEIPRSAFLTRWSAARAENRRLFG